MYPHLAPQLKKFSCGKCEKQDYLDSPVLTVCLQLCYFNFSMDIFLRHPSEAQQRRARQMVQEGSKGTKKSLKVGEESETPPLAGFLCTGPGQNVRTCPAGSGESKPNTSLPFRQGVSPLPLPFNLLKPSPLLILHSVQIIQ
jgi:hypothetical protein